MHTAGVLKIGEPDGQSRKHQKTDRTKTKSRCGRPVWGRQTDSGRAHSAFWQERVGFSSGCALHHDDKERLDFVVPENGGNRMDEMTGKKQPEKTAESAKPKRRNYSHRPRTAKQGAAEKAAPQQGRKSRKRLPLSRKRARKNRRERTVLVASLHRDAGRNCPPRQRPQPQRPPRRRSPGPRPAVSRAGATARPRFGSSRWGVWARSARTSPSTSAART